MKRRNFINLSVLSAGGATLSLSTFSGCNSKPNTGSDINISKEEGDADIATLKSMTEDVKPVSLEERQSRITKAQKLMRDQEVDYLIMDAGTSMKYFTGISWWPSERSMLAIIPSNDEIFYICPAFELDRFQERIQIGSKVLTWQEDENPFQILLDNIEITLEKIPTIAFEERTRFFIINGIQKLQPAFRYMIADDITVPCRIIKSENEIALMQKATEITIEAIKYGFSQLKEGCTQNEISSAIARAHSKFGGQHLFALVLFGESSSYPHGSKNAKPLKKGDVVLVDCGCAIEGYNSDISRTIVFGDPSQKQQDIWNLERKAQQAGFDAAKIGAPLGDVDKAARQVIIDAGFGPDYKLPGLPHRTGHGIGMDGHEWGNAVRNNERKIEVGMCFSIEPTIAIPGEFGVRHEDCVYISEEGPKWFSQPGPSIDRPFV